MFAAAAFALAAAAFAPPLHTFRPSRAAPPRVLYPAAARAQETPYKELNVTTVADMLEATFVPACMGLAQGDVSTLKLFVAAAQAGHGRRLPVAALDAQMEAMPRQSAGRPLAAEERELRLQWLTMAYLALDELTSAGSSAGSAGGDDPGPGGDPVGAALRERHGGFVSRLLEARRGGEALSSLPLDEWAAGGSETPIEKAIRAQSARVVYLTATVLEEVEAAQGSASADGAQPQKAKLGSGMTFIPGTGTGVD